MIAIDVSKQQAVDADPKAKEQINFTGNLAQDPIANTKMFSIIKEAKKKKKHFRFLTRNYESILILFFVLI